MSGSLSNLLSSITSQLNITPSKLFAGGLVICWKVFTDLIAVESNVLFWSVIAALLFLWGFSHKHVDEFLKKDHPTMGKRLSWICGVIILAWFGWPWPRVQGWFRADNFIVYEAKISPVGVSVSTLDGRLNISWTHLTRHVWFKITDFESGSEPLKATLSRGGIWRFDIDGVDYLLEIIRWPRNTDDTIIFNVKLAPPLPEMQAIDTSTGIAAVRDTCLSYNVTFTEIDIRDYSKSPADSVQLLFKAEPHSKLIWLTFDTLGIYPLSISFNYVATRSGNVVWGMEFIAPKVKGYVWPTVSGSWPRNDPSINRVHVDTADNKFITYILKYEIECEKEL